MRTVPILAVGLLARLCSATPVEAAVAKADRALVINRANAIDRALMQSCQAQSCSLADASGSTGRAVSVIPEGGNDEDMKCIFKYNKEAESVIKGRNATGNPVPPAPRQDIGFSTTIFKALDGLQRPNERAGGEVDHGSFTAPCAKNILIYSKGTLEPFPYGISIGLTLPVGLDSSWSVSPVLYDATVSGDFCLALPGGMVAKDMINQAAAKCPTSNIFMAGYSQGAMVVRNGVAYANPSAKARVKGVITFGDPFNGAPIRGYNGPIKTYCQPADGVCGGNFELAFAHLAYPFDGSVAAAKAYLVQLAANSAQ